MLWEMGCLKDAVEHELWHLWCYAGFGEVGGRSCKHISSGGSPLALWFQKASESRLATEQCMDMCGKVIPPELACSCRVEQGAGWNSEENRLCYEN